MKWIDLRERRPRTGQLVALLYSETVPWSSETTTLIVAAKFGFGHHMREHTGLFPTHWYPPPERPPERDIDPKSTLTRSAREKIIEIEGQLKKRAPMLEWSVKPGGLGRQGVMAVQADLDVVGAETLHCDIEVDALMISRVKLDWIEYVMIDFEKMRKDLGL